MNGRIGKLGKCWQPDAGIAQVRHGAVIDALIDDVGRKIEPAHRGITTSVRDTASSPEYVTMPLMSVFILLDRNDPITR